jgi:3-dehydroquinate dehydratase-2
VNFEFFQSNHEGEIVDALQKADSQADGIIVNAAGYSHTSVAIADAFAAVSIPKIEVHISNIYRREKFRHQSLLAPHANGIIIGIGFKGYLLAAQAIVS